MMQQEFDTYAKSYSEVLNNSLIFSGEDSAYFAEYKIRDLYDEIQKAGIDAKSPLQLLDFGCGVGSSMPYARKYFQNAELLGVDVSEESLSVAKLMHGAIAKFMTMRQNELPLDVPKIDAAFAMCVFHHIDEVVHVLLLSEIRSRLKPNGVLMIYEHNPFNPLTVRVVNNCPFDENAKLIPASVMFKRCKNAGFREIQIKYRVFFPKFLKIFRFAERLFSWLPLGGQYYVRCLA